MKRQIILASDHAGYRLKQLIIDKYDCIDLGTDSPDINVDYNDFADALVARILISHGFGILICKTGIGMSIAANRYMGIRAALCTNVEVARMTREHNNANILVLPADVINPFEIIKVFFETPFSSEARYIRRIKKLG